MKHRVAAVFHGHDHLYARQERDGVVYQATGLTLGAFGVRVALSPK